MSQMCKMPPSRRLVKVAKERWKVRKEAAAATKATAAAATVDEGSGGYDPDQIRMVAFNVMPNFVLIR